MPLPLTPLRRRLLTMVLLSTLPLVICAAFALFMLLRNEENQAFTRALEANRQTATAVRVTLDRSFTVLAAVAQSPLLDDNNLGPFNDLMERMLPLMPNWHSLLIASPKGRVLGRVSPHSGAALPAPVELSSFAHLVETHKPVVGSMAKGPSGTWAIPLRVPVIREGKVRYVLTAPLLPEAISNVLALSRLPPSWRVTVLDNNGRRIARSPSSGFAVGSQGSAELAALVKAGSDEGSGITLTTEGDEVYTAYIRVPDLGWTVVTGIPTTEVTARVTKVAMLYGGGLALSLLLAALGALFAARRINAPMRELRDAALAVGRRETPSLPITRITEIHEVGTALKQASEALAASEGAQREGMERLAAAHEELLEADRRKDIYLATLAHELRNPLAPVVHAAALLRSEDSSPSGRDRNLAVIERQTGHLGRLLDDLLDVSRINVGTITLRKEHLDLREVLRDAFEAVQAKAANKKLDIRRSTINVPIYVEGDGLRLQQIFVNLLDNAVKYTPSGGHISLNVLLQDMQVAVEIADDGIGIPEDKMEGIFHMFGRVANPGVDVGGLGIGLSLARHLIQLHEGELKVSSPGLGHGSRFTVTLALSKKQFSSLPLAQAPATEVLKARRIVVADDNGDITFTLQALFEMEGHQVRVADDGQQAVALCSQEMPEVAVLDIGMPNLDGHQAARTIRALPGGEKVFLVALSGWGRAEDVSKAREAGFDQHLTKPPDLDALLSLVSTGARAAMV